MVVIHFERVDFPEPRVVSYSLIKGGGYTGDSTGHYDYWARVIVWSVEEWTQLLGGGEGGW